MLIIIIIIIIIIIVIIVIYALPAGVIMYTSLLHEPPLPFLQLVDRP